MIRPPLLLPPLFIRTSYLFARRSHPPVPRSRKPRVVALPVDRRPGRSFTVLRDRLTRDAVNRWR